MRIALLPSAFAPYVGGVEILTDRLARNLLLAGHDVEIWTARSPDDGLADDELVDDLRVCRFVFDAPRASLQSAGWPVRGAAIVLSMRHAARRFKPDVLHVQCFGVNGVYATLLSAVCRVPLVVTLQGETFMDDDDIYENSAFVRTGLRLGLRRARAVTGCSQFVLDDARARFGLDSGAGQVVFNGVDLEEIEPSAFRPPFDRFVLALGRIEHRKGFDLLVDAWGRTARGHPKVGLVLGGTGTDLQRLRSLVREKRLEKSVFFAGPMTRADVAATMKAADVFVMPSRVEAFGIVALEAWRAGTPAIVTANGGAVEFVEDGVTGLVVDPTDVESLADRIDRLLADADLRRRLASGATAALGAFEWSQIRKEYESVYEAVVQGGKAKS